MDTKQMEQIVMATCHRNEWLLNPNEDLRSIMEELGELCREVRRFETGRQRPDEIDPDKETIREDMALEIGDILFPLIKLATYYGITLEEAFQAHHAKLEKLYEEED